MNIENYSENCHRFLLVIDSLSQLQIVVASSLFLFASLLASMTRLFSFMARAHRGPRLIIRVVKNIYEGVSQQLSISNRTIDTFRWHHSFANLVYI